MRSLSVRNLLRAAYLRYFSKPAAERALYRALSARPIRSIVELGVGLPQRALRLFELAQSQQPGGSIRYTGIDLFELRPAGEATVTLKQAFAALRLPNVAVQLVPGEPDAALRRVANSLSGTDLLLIAANQSRESLAKAWTWMPRMLTAQSLIFVEEPAKQLGLTQWRQLPLSEIQQLAHDASKAVRRAA
jgi:hypothetical protein